jgi:ribosome biogenesis GTPase A
VFTTASNEADAAAELAAEEDDRTLGDTRSGKRSRRERQDSVTDTIMDQRREHIARLRTFEPDAAVVAELRQAGLGRRKQPGDGKIFAKKFENNKRVETGMGAGGFALHIGSASSDWPTFKHNLPEIALAGHTNCGKSTLVNALAGIHPRQVRSYSFFVL